MSRCKFCHLVIQQKNRFALVDSENIKNLPPMCIASKYNQNKHFQVTYLYMCHVLACTINHHYNCTHNCPMYPCICILGTGRLFSLCIHQHLEQWHSKETCMVNQHKVLVGTWNKMKARVSLWLSCSYYPIPPGLQKAFDCGLRTHI